MSKLLPCPFLSVRPLRCMVDEKFEVRVQGLVPGARVTLHALLQSEDGDFWEGFGHYVSDKAGNVSGTFKAFFMMLVYKLLHIVLYSSTNTQFAVFQSLKMPVWVAHMMELKPWVCCGA